MLNDLTAGEVIAFLQHVETGRGASIATRNCRLAALRSFFLFVADREPSAAAQCAEVLRIPSKKKAKRAICYLEQEEVAIILAQPDRIHHMNTQRPDEELASLMSDGYARAWAQR